MISTNKREVDEVFRIPLILIGNVKHTMRAISKYASIRIKCVAEAPLLLAQLSIQDGGRRALHYCLSVIKFSETENHGRLPGNK